MKKIMGLLGLVAVIGLTGAGSAQAADREFCREYTRTALRQVEMARDSWRCRRWVDFGSTRWASEWAVHFGWCRDASYGDANHERNERRRVLERCRY
jgi:hypothetical protein